MARRYKWEIFVDKVLGGMTQLQAYKTTFNCRKMTDEQISVEASNLLNGTGKYKTNPKASLMYKELNKKAQEEADSKAVADATEVLTYLTAVMRGEEKDEKPYVNTLGEVEMMTVRHQTNQIKAAELLAKRYGLLIDKVDSEIDMELNINIDYGGGEIDADTES